MTTPFQIEGPDEDGNVWLRTFNDISLDGIYLGPKDQVAETLSQWLASIDHEERTF